MKSMSMGYRAYPPYLYVEQLVYKPRFDVIQRDCGLNISAYLLCKKYLMIYYYRSKSNKETIKAFSPK